MSDSHKASAALLADALWWFKGYRAGAQQIEAWGNSDPTEGLGDGLRGVREWLCQLARGSRRVLGVEERTLAIVMTEAEFERIYDGLRGHSGPADRALARETAETILREFQREQRETPDDDIPF